MAPPPQALMVSLPAPPRTTAAGPAITVSSPSPASTTLLPRLAVRLSDPFSPLMHTLAAEAEYPSGLLVRVTVVVPVGQHSCPSSQAGAVAAAWMISSTGTSSPGAPTPWHERPKPMSTPHGTRKATG